MGEPDSAFLRAVGARIAELRRERSLTQDALSQRLEVATKYLQRVEQGAENLTLRQLERIALELSVKPIHLLLPPLTPRSTRAGRPAAKSNAPTLPIRRVAPRPGAREIVPLYTLVASAGPGGRADLAEIGEWVAIEGHKIPPGAFVLRTSGDSMAPGIPDGSLVLFRSPVQAPDGKVVLVEISEDGSVPHYLLKRVSMDWRAHAESGVVSAKLVSDNKKYAARSVEISADGGVRLVAEMIAKLGGAMT